MKREKWTKKERNDLTMQFKQLYSQYSLLSNIQVQGESVYAGRTGVITLAQGLLLSVFGGLASVGGDNIDYLRKVVAITGSVLSILWYFFEQRNNVYYNARGSVLSDIEERLVSLAHSLGIDFARFWTEVGLRVQQHAKWNQRFSAPLILRTLVPLLFVATWLAALFYVLRINDWVFALFVQLA